MPARILIIDRNRAFAAMLEQMLASEGGHEVQVAFAADDALSVLRNADFDLTILDMGLGEDGPDCKSVVQEVRVVRPQMRLMLIPVMGNELPDEVMQWDIQGHLSKPFFVDDLLPSIDEALSQTVSKKPEARTEPVVRPELVMRKSTAPVVGTAPGMRAALVELARETTADAVLLLSTKPGAAGVVEHVSALQAEDLARLSALVRAIVDSAQAAARFLGQPDEAFIHHLFESRDLRLYAMTLSAEWLLVVTTPIHIPLGTIRHNLRRIGRDLTVRALT